jgi:hypothetical protein
MKLYKVYVGGKTNNKLYTRTQLNCIKKIAKEKNLEFKTKVIYDNAKVLDNDESLECVKCFIDLSGDTHKKVFGY